MLMTIRDQIKFYRGDSVDIEFRIQYEDGTAVDLTPFNVRFSVVTTAIMKLSTDPAQVTINDAAGGVATVHLKPADTAALLQNYNYTYDAEIYNGVDVYTFSQGTFKLI